MEEVQRSPRWHQDDLNSEVLPLALNRFRQYATSQPHLQLGDTFLGLLYPVKLLNIIMNKNGIYISLLQ